MTEVSFSKQCRRFVDKSKLRESSYDTSIQWGCSAVENQLKTKAVYISHAKGTDNTLCSIFDRFRIMGKFSIDFFSSSVCASILFDFIFVISLAQITKKAEKEDQHCM